jgi:alkanesulfonate monooxygenase SsuD/methylene tetrahydromethanopterin reductase-like flavin-dependent oxidoreductase (luciferase family)
VHLAEALGLESVWTVEHHFTPYILVPNPVQLLTYFAGTTSRLEMGTMVAVLPWHNPLRLAAEVAVLDILLGGRRLHLGLGRGTSKTEFDAFGIDMNTTRARFAETLDVLRLALTNERFSYQGEYFAIPEVTTRPRPRSPDLVERFLMAWGSPESLPIAAKAGLKPIFIPQRSWADYAAEVRRFNEIRAEHGWRPVRPTAAVWLYCAPSRSEAEEEGTRHIIEYADSARLHYLLDRPDVFSQVKGYEHYGDRASRIAAAIEGGADRKTAAFRTLRSVSVLGTPRECLEQLEAICRGLTLEHFIGVFQFGTMPRDLAERSLRLFAQHVAPVLKQIDVAPQPRLESV